MSVLKNEYQSEINILIWVIRNDIENIALSTKKMDGYLMFFLQTY